MASTNTHTVALIDNLRKLNTGLLKLIKMFKLIKDILEKKKERLTVPAQLSDKMYELFKLVILEDDKLEDVQELLDPAYPPVVYKIKKERRKVDSLKRSIEKPKKETYYSARKTGLLAEKIQKFGKNDIDTIVKDLRAVQSFIKKELQLLGTAREANTNLSDSRYKNRLLEQLNTSSGSLDKILVTPNEVAGKIQKSLSRMNSIISEIDRLCKKIEWAVSGATAAIDELNRMENATDELYEGLRDKILIDTTEHPLLTPVRLRIDRVSGLDEGMKNLELLFSKLNDADRLKNTIIASVSNFKTDHNLQRQFEKN